MFPYLYVPIGQVKSASVVSYVIWIFTETNPIKKNGTNTIYCDSSSQNATEVTYFPKVSVGVSSIESIIRHH